MKSILLYIFLLFSALTAKSQYTVILKDGRALLVDNVKFTLTGDFKLKNDGGNEKMKFQREEVACYTDGAKVFFPVCVEGRDCYFYPRYQEGTIMVFQELVQTVSAPGPKGIGGGSSITYYYYARKNGVDRFLLSTNSMFVNKTRGEGYLREFVNDDKEILDKLSDEKFKFRVDPVLDLINEYNVRHFSKDQVVDSIKGNVIFYIKSKREPKPPLELVVNDSITHPLRYASLVPIEIKGSPAKVCVGSSCYLLSLGYKPVYYEIELDKKTGAAKFAKTTVVDAMRYIDFIKSR